MTHSILIMTLAASMPLIGAVGLRYLYRRFLAQGLICLAHCEPNDDWLGTIDRELACATEGLLSVGGLLAGVSLVLDFPVSVIVLPVVLGILVAFGQTVRALRVDLDLRPWMVVVVALLAFAGGNLPLLVGEAVLMMLSVMT